MDFPVQAIKQVAARRNIDWKGAAQGNYIPNPPASPTAAPKAPPTGNLDAASVDQLANDKLNTLDTSLALWNIQPGLSTVMMEYAKRMAQLKHAFDAANWDMAKYQLDEMIEIQEVGETTRPGRVIEAVSERIWVESESGHGATFRFALPLAHA